jgi:glycosyltransferase involved in cell wall biosynthesis
VRSVKVSAVISARNEFPSVVHTVHSIINDLETFLAPGEFEIIVVDNLSDDEDSARRSAGGTADFLRARGAYANGAVKLLYDPIAGNVSARNKGAGIARGEYLFFSDAHMSYRPGAFRRMIETVDESGGIVHPAVAWMGSYPPETVYQYSWRLGDGFEGAWNGSCLSSEWFYVPASGHCCLGLRRKQFFDYRGYPDRLRTYGAGGMFLDTKWWMLGSTVVTEPRALAWHLSAGRAYSYSEGDYIYNLFHAALILGADAWAERTYFHYLRKAPQHVLDGLWDQAQRDAQDHRLFVNQCSRMAFDELLVRRPWDTLNDARIGGHSSGLLIAAIPGRKNQRKLG